MSVTESYGTAGGAPESSLQDKIAKAYGTSAKPLKEYNPFLKKSGELVNPYINYQSVLDNPRVTQKAKYFIEKATGLQPTKVSDTASGGYAEYTKESGVNKSQDSPDTFTFNSNADENNLASLDVTTDLPKLSTGQISEIISKHFSNSPVIKPSDAEGIYNAQQKSGMSALAILGIGALESGYGTSSIAKQKNNIWGWNATNVNPGGNATAFSQMSQGASEFADAYMKTYYNGYGAKSIQSAGTGDNPSGKGYAYYDNGTINTKWAKDVGSIMRDFYRTAKSVVPTQTAPAASTGSSIVDSAKSYMGTPYIWGGSTKSGMDCSGFVYNALKNAGYNVDRTTADGYRSRGTIVKKSDLQPGDLVFYGKDNYASHIGIYIGNGQIIHSSGGRANTASNPGKGVTTSGLDYRNDFIEARRY